MSEITLAIQTRDALCDAINVANENVLRAINSGTDYSLLAMARGKMEDALFALDEQAISRFGVAWVDAAQPKVRFTRRDAIADS